MIFNPITEGLAKLKDLGFTQVVTSNEQQRFQVMYNLVDLVILPPTRPGSIVTGITIFSRLTLFSFYNSNF